MPRPSSDAVQVAFRIPKAWLKRADSVAEAITRPGVKATRTDALRHAMALGFDALEREGKRHA